MKKILLMIFVSMFILPTAYADEEIQLAAIMNASGSSNIQANKRIYAVDENQMSMGSGFSSTSFRDDYEYGIIAGAIIAAAIAYSFQDNGASSTVTH